MKKRVLSLFLSLLFILISTSLKANGAKNEETPLDERNNRKGFFLSFGPNLGTEMLQFKQLGTGAALRIGGGITDRTLLYTESTIFYIRDNGVNYYAGDFQGKVQHFFWQNALYANFGGGFSIGNYNSTSALRTTKPGFIVSAGSGYEFHVFKRFAVSPELGLYYRRIGGVSYFAPIGMVNFALYF